MCFLKIKYSAVLVLISSLIVTDMHFSRQGGIWYMQWIKSEIILRWIIFMWSWICILVKAYYKAKQMRPLVYSYSYDLQYHLTIKVIVSGFEWEAGPDLHFLLYAVHIEHFISWTGYTATSQNHILFIG